MLTWKRLHKFQKTTPLENDESAIVCAPRGQNKRDPMRHINVDGSIYIHSLALSLFYPGMFISWYISFNTWNEQRENRLYEVILRLFEFFNCFLHEWHTENQKHFGKLWSTAGKNDDAIKCQQFCLSLSYPKGKKMLWLHLILFFFCFFLDAVYFVCDFFACYICALESRVRKFNEIDLRKHII